MDSASVEYVQHNSYFALRESDSIGIVVGAHSHACNKVKDGLSLYKHSQIELFASIFDQTKLFLRQ